MATSATTKAETDMEATTSSKVVNLEEPSANSGGMVKTRIERKGKIGHNGWVRTRSEKNNNKIRSEGKVGTNTKSRTRRRALLGSYNENVNDRGSAAEPENHKQRSPGRFLRELPEVRG